MFTTNSSITQKISNYDLIDLLKYNAACFLLPENANKIMRLELMANYIISNHYLKGKPFISKSNLRNMYKSQLKEIEWAEDPPEQMYTNSILFHGGNYTVLPGINENGPYIVQHLLNGIHSTEYLSEKMKSDALSLSHFILTVSDRMCKKVSYEPLIKAKYTREDIVIPINEQENILKDAVTFSKTFVHELAHQTGVKVEDFIINFGEVALERYNPDNHALQSKIFVDCESEYVIINPANLIGTLRHSIICKAIQNNEEGILASIFTDSVWRDVNRSLWYMDFKRIQLIDKSNMHLREGIYKFDEDKAAYVILLTDDFTKYRSDEPYGMAEVDEVLVNDHLLNAKTKYKHLLNGYSEVFTVVILQHCGRMLGVSFEKYVGEQGVKLSADDLKIFSAFEEGNSLALYYFSKLMKTYRVQTVNFLDAYAYFLDNKKSFYNSDNIGKSFLWLMPGDCRQVVEKYFFDYNPHGVPSPTYDSYIEVENFNRDGTIPIYSPVLNKMFLGGLFVKRGVVGSWIITSGSSLEEFRFVDTIAYWLWQFEELLTLIVKRNYLTIIVSFCDDSNQEYVEINRESTNIFRINIYQNISEFIADKSNTGERLIVSKILELLNQSFNRNIGRMQMESFIEEIMPLGPKKKLLLFDSSINNTLLLEPVANYEVRYVEPIVTEYILDEIGTYLFDSGKYKIGRDYGSDLLNDAVGYLFNKFEGIIKNLENPKGALIECMGRYESIIKKREEAKFTMVTSTYCFPTNNVLHFIKEEDQKLNQLSVPLRFVIEYLGTVNLLKGSGAEKFSKATFDELVAIVSQIIHLANYSDLVRYNLTNLKISLLPSKRIGFSNRQNYEEASIKFLNTNILEILDAANEKFNKYWNAKESQQSKINFLEKINQPFKEEFGVYFEEYIRFMNALIDITYIFETDVCNLTKDNFVKEIKDITGFTESTIDKFIELLVLPKRKDFLKVSKPYSINDVVPWKFNRELSYLRKPIIHNNDSLIWSKKHVYVAMHQMISLCMGGRLKAKSKSMKEFISLIQNVDGSSFNEEVFKLFNGDSLIVDKQVKKIGNKKISSEDGLDLGDIDVLVVNPKKKIILLLECKDLSVARNVYEISNELINVYQGTADKRSIVQKHQRRYEWIKSNLSNLLEKYNLDELKVKWTIKPIVILSQAMITPHLYKGKSKVDVIPYRLLKDLVESGEIYWK